jgi:hypothetical protein
MEEFYANIKELVKKKTVVLSDKEILEKHKKEVIDFITADYKINIQNAAEHDNGFAYLLICGVNARYKEVIHIYDLLMETDVLREKSASLGVSSLLEDLKKFFTPFKLETEMINYDEKDYVILKVAW